MGKGLSKIERLRRDYLNHVYRCAKCQAGKHCDTKKGLILQLGTIRISRIVAGLQEEIKALRRQVKTLEENQRDLVGIGVDVDIPLLNHPSYVIIFSRIKGGQLRIFPVHIQSIREMEIMAANLAARYQVSSPVIDAPAGWQGFEWRDKPRNVTDR